MIFAEISLNGVTLSLEEENNLVAHGPSAEEVSLRKCTVSPGFMVKTFSQNPKTLFNFGILLRISTR